MRIADKIQKYLKDNLDKRIKSYYFGDPLTIPVSNMPAVIISKRSTDIAQGATGLDEASKTYSIKLVFNKKDEIGKTPDEQSVQRTISDIVEGLDSTSHYVANSIMGVIRKYFTLGDTINDQTISVEYFIAERGDVITEEAELIINIKDFVSVDTRS